ncbi:MAG: PIN domain-containing protein [Pleurocapsa minor HA4230-MV1]|jgi:predicted nucleic acid-binding protein|nr:PIN domain-containing protein [Pleurocapsa minor HA4230-MV1]
MAYLFDTDAISETLRKKPLKEYVEWLTTLTREEQYTSSIVISELYKGAYRSLKKEQLTFKIRTTILPVLTVLPFDTKTAQIYGQIAAQLEQTGQKLAHPDLQIAATAIQHKLELVTGNIKHFARIPDLAINPILSRLRSQLNH